MKLVKLTFLLFFLYFVFTNNTNAFLSTDTWLNLYKNIDKWLYDLEIKVFQKELRWWDDSKEVYENLNRFTMEFYNIAPCFNENVAIKSNNQYIEINDVYNFIDDACKDNKWNIAVSNIATYQTAINDFIKYSQRVSKQKTKNIYQISRIWLYSDWTTDNSPFDIIVDLQEIDKIIFWEELNYDWEDQGFLDNFKKNPNYKPSSLSNYDTDYPSSDYPTNNFYWNDYTKLFNLSTDICADESWLSNEQLQSLTNTSVWWENNTDNNAIDKEIDEIKFMWTNFEWTWYSKVNDNSVWPCNDFFCIKVNFSTYNHSVLWYWETKSIQWVLEKSNEHLKKWANTSLQQAKMTTNNFEISLRDIDFAEMFHLWVVVQTKSPPLLDLENAIESDNIPENDKDTKTGLSHKLAERLREYYKNLGLDYDRANDLNIYLKKDEELKNIINSAELNPQFLLSKEEELKKIAEIKAKQNEYINDSVDKKIHKDILKEFYIEFVELERFTWAIKDYTDTLYWLIKKLREIPIFKD